MDFVCQENQFVNNNICIDCPPGKINQAGDDASGENTYYSGSILCRFKQYHVLNNICIENVPLEQLIFLEMMQVEYHLVIVYCVHQIIMFF